MSRTKYLWGLWLASTAAAAAILLAGFFYGGPTRAYFLIGETTSGHHQIELSCTTCHTSPFSGREEIEKTCRGCHEAELKSVKDSHPDKKFRDPRNADRLEKLAANKCITCHTEHKPEITNAMGVTLPTNYCALCHQDVGKNRKSHVGLAYNTCATAGCHNYHDNTALYEDFLEKHAHSAELKKNPVVKLRLEKIEIEAAGPALISADAADAPSSIGADQKITEDWLATKHAAAGVNCSACHAPKHKSDKAIAANWQEKPGYEVCSTCHDPDTKTWILGKHGMRMAPKMFKEKAGFYGLFKDQPLSPMRPELARVPMQSKVAHTELGCTNCHSAHKFDTSVAQVDSCMSCHADDHTRAYKKSPHFKLWQAELSGEGQKGSGVSCATCHMPRTSVESADGWEEILVTNHNQNANLRPNEKMIRSVCMNCHGLGFSIDALADKKLIDRNFAGRPSVHVESIDWVLKRLKERGEASLQTKEPSPN